jgi:hypothetical protein
LTIKIEIKIIEIKQIKGKIKFNCRKILLKGKTRKNIVKYIYFIDLLLYKLKFKKYF